ncbi:glycosyltransferase [Selenomonas dianae]|uniref:Glycosyltransferase family 4 protein n=1 Tax=Selenomonas dianae TaxID=135079 RepID=A0ABP3CLY0_9FIRM|nr:glycosyltransferase [Selenomonas dianae]WLD81927.1 glycosyltransferase [Selenomonas dianae]
MRILLANFSKMVGDTGGAAKVNVAFANEMVRRGHTVTTVYTDDREGAFFYPLDERVTAYNLQHFRGTHCTFPTALKIKREVLRAFGQRYGRSVNDEFFAKHIQKNMAAVLDEVQPDVIICFQTSSAKMLLCDLRIETPVIIMSHGDPVDLFQTHPKEELPALERCAVFQVLLPGFAERVQKYIPNVRVVPIGNVVPQYTEQADLAREKEMYKIIFIGRMVRNHKRPHLLIAAFCKIAAEFPDWTLELWGAEDSKSYQKEMLRMIAAAGLEDRILFCGTTAEIPRVLQGADLCVAPSAYEGFSLAHTEAMSMGLPLIGYQSCVSVAELIDDGVNGLLAADGAEPLAEKMTILMRDRNLRVKMGNAARVSMRAYAPKIIWTKWENLMREVMSS